MNPDTLNAIDERLDRLCNLDIGGRGVEHLYVAARQRQGQPLVGAAAEALLAVPEGATVFLTTGSVSRAWISPAIGENDGPAGAAVIMRLLVQCRRAHCVLFAEDSLLAGMHAILTSAGLTVLPFDAAQRACQDGSLWACTLLPFPIQDDVACHAATALLAQYAPALLFSTERGGRSRDGCYYSMRALDYSVGRARVDRLFDAALAAGIPTVAVGDGGNEIGMGAITDAVAQYVKFGEKIAAVTPADVLVTAACSNWGCSAIAAAVAARQGNARLLHTPELEGQLLQRGVDVGLINAVHNRVDANVDGLALPTHLAFVQMLRAVVEPALA